MQLLPAASMRGTDVNTLWRPRSVGTRVAQGGTAPLSRWAERAPGPFSFCLRNL